MEHECLVCTEGNIAGNLLEEVVFCFLSPSLLFFQSKHR